tara:strand:- start:3120 stop:3386 length:267 start_codon:yes stop_codon:yes gene_type:complete
MRMNDDSDKKITNSQSKVNESSDIKDITFSNKGKNMLTSNTITYTIALLILFIQSILILFSSIKIGILKKEILTKKSNVGFDIIIKSQ